MTASASTSTARGPSAPPTTAAQAARSRGPLGTLVDLVVGLVFATITSWFFGTALTIVGDHSFWQGDGVRQARAAVEEDFTYIRGFPRSLLVRDTVAFAHQLADLVSRPYLWLHAPRFIAWANAIDPSMEAKPQTRAARRIVKETGRWVEISLYVAQDTVIRLAVAFYALPAFAMAILLGLVDGLVRRDLRKWSGGRESSFVYHHSKRFTWWFLTAGLTAYLAWPFGGFNPAYLVLAFAILVAASVSATASTFKKYL